MVEKSHPLSFKNKNPFTILNTKSQLMHWLLFAIMIILQSVACDSLLSDVLLFWFISGSDWLINRWLSNETYPDFQKEEVFLKEEKMLLWIILRTSLFFLFFIFKRIFTVFLI